VPRASGPEIVKTRDRTFGDRLKEFRSAAGFTHEELAVRSRLSVRGISDLERGLIRRPRPVTVRLLADALQLGPGDRACLEAAARPPRARPCAFGDEPFDPRLTGTSDASVVGVPNNLPSELTSFVGREGDLADLSSRLCDLNGPRLLTLTGAGGCGKTRLALRVASLVGVAYPDGLWLVDLAPLVDPALVLTSVATALGLIESDRVPAAALLAQALCSRRLLLILDNCEHLIDAVAQLAEVLLRSCPYLRILATSREPLRIPGEVAWRVRSLSVPAPGEGSGALVGSEAVHLFVDRATAAAPGFRLTDEDAAAVAQICRRLDGIPLAVELAAARLSLLGIEQLAARLDDRFRLLIAGSRTAPPRHQTLRAVIDWSYELLSPIERAVLRHLAVFAGGWTLEAAEAVGVGSAVVDGSGAGKDAGTGSHRPTPDGVLNVLGRLVDKSLVLGEEVGGARRYRLLETVRHYAEEKLRDSGELAEIRQRHRDWYLALSEAASPELNGPRHGEWMRRLSAEHDNVRAALAWCRESPEGAEAGLRLVVNIGWYFVSSQRFGEGCRWLDEFLARVPRRDALRARALEAVARIRLHDGDVPGTRERAEELLTVAGKVGDERLQLDAEVRMALVEASEGAYPGARARLEALLPVAEGMGDLAVCWEVTVNLGLIAIATGDDARARPLLEESLRLARRTRIDGLAAMVLLRLSILDRLVGNYTLARREVEEVGAIFREAHVTEDHTLTCRGNLTRAQGQFVEAHALLTEALRRGEQRGDRRAMAEKLAWLGVLAVAEGDTARGVRLIAAATAENPFIAPIHVPDARREAAASLDRARGILGGDAFERAWSEGTAMLWDDAVAEALADLPGV
jgi:non-specific serine/threonine protein kinase